MGCCTTLAAAIGQNVQLTLVKYGPDAIVSCSVAEHPGFFFLINGQLLEERASIKQQQTLGSLRWHEQGGTYSRAVGPDGALGLEICYSGKMAGDMPSSIAGTEYSGGLFSIEAIQLVRLCLLGGAEKEIEERAGDLLFLASSPDLGKFSLAERLRQEIKRRSLQAVSIRDVAISLGIHPVTASKVFQRAFGIAPSEYLRRHRLAKALHCVLIEGLSIGQAAHMCQFADQPHLTRTCNYFTGATVGDFRKVFATLD